MSFTVTNWRGWRGIATHPIQEAEERNRAELCIHMATEQVYKLDPKRLYATYFGGDDKQGLAADDEARGIWCAPSYAVGTWSRETLCSQ